MRVDWAPLRAELALWRASGRTPALWWRDDDAVAETADLHRLLDLGAALKVPVHLAIIPSLIEPSLPELLAARPGARPLVHGWAHRNQAPEGAKKAEFNHPRPGLESEAAEGLLRLRAQFGPRALPIFVPPWNRICPELIAALPGLGYAALSTYTPRAQREATPGLIQVNTHLDPIHWRGGGGLLAPEVLVAQMVQLLADQREGRSDEAEPLGLLTHHLVHDAAIWAFSRALLEELLAGGARPLDLTVGLP